MKDPKIKFKSDKTGIINAVASQMNEEKDF
jgi:hypothetical protein